MIRCLLVRALLQEARRNELTLPPNPSWQSSDSDENAAWFEEEILFCFFFKFWLRFDENVFCFVRVKRIMTTLNGKNVSTDYSPLSVGEPNVKLLKLELRFWYGLGDGGTGADSSTGRHVSTIASKQLTNSSDDSPIILYCES